VSRDELLTRDQILRGKLALWQPHDGYRFSLDPLLLIDFVKTPFGQVIEFCAGVGVIGLGLLLRDVAATLVQIEIQERLAKLARRNADENQLGERVQVRHADLTSELNDIGARFDLAVANPPYRSLDEGPASPDTEVATAQHELTLTLAALTATMRRALKPGGRAALIYPAARLPTLLAALDGENLRPRRARFVHPRVGEPANRVLVEAHKGKRGPLVVESPLRLRDATGAYTAEAKFALGEG
jgi:tRNA1Val (adenine37-N6)-methyltransferase